MAALFYLPRLFVYHAMSTDKISRERFHMMERKLYRGIATPAMIATLIFGLCTASYNWQGFMAAGWFQLKLGLVAGLIGYHFCCRHFINKLAANENIRSHIFYRWFNEAPIFLMVPIVLLVVLKPF